MTRSNLADLLEIAVNDPSPDRRRAAVVRVSRTKHLTRDEVIDTLSAIAIEDRSDSVRCAAIRALGVGGGHRAIDPMLTLLDPSNDRPTPGPTVHTDALDLLTLHAHSHHLTQHQRERSAIAAIALVNTYPDRAVRLAAARLLGHCPETESLSALIEALRQRDFGVVYQAERSLMRLTGQSFDHDAHAWQGWLQSTHAPFANAGALNAQLDPLQRPWYQRARQKMNQTMASFAPKKE